MQARLVFDGDCGFCRYTVAYARGVTGEQVEYRPYQEVAEEHPEVSAAEFAAAIVLFTNEGRFTGADAAFRTLALGGRRLWRHVYRLPGAAVVFEWLYRLTTRRREACYRLAKLLFGRSLGPRSHRLTADLLYRGIALCGLLAFVSLWWQAPGLIGSGGILPLESFFESLHDTYGNRIYRLVPSVFWIDTGNAALHVVCAVGVLATLLGVLGRLRCTAALVAYAAYLSLFYAGQVFTSFQWDILLIECLVLAAVLSRAPTAGIWLARLLLFRFMLLSGAVKLLSGDPTWADASALEYHFETQPLPTVLAWFAHQLPAAVLGFGVLATFAIELVLPFFVFLPRNPRLLAGAAFVLLEVLIALTGSYNFFNLLTVVLCLSLLDDPPGERRRLRLRGMAELRGRRWGALAAAFLIGIQGLVITGASLLREPPPEWLRVASPLLLANGYGLFAVMTTQRRELVVEGSSDGEQWVAYSFPFKPGLTDVAPRLAAPHQPRLDWQLWFAVLGPPAQSPWIYDFVFALLEARPAVLALLHDPFAGEAPAFVRIQRYRYRFSTPAERAVSGAWWVRGEPEVWLEPVRLNRPRITHEPLEVPARN